MDTSPAFVAATSRRLEAALGFRRAAPRAALLARRRRGARAAADEAAGAPLRQVARLHRRAGRALRPRADVEARGGGHREQRAARRPALHADGGARG